MNFQDKLERAPLEIERMRWDILKKYGKKIEIEARNACPTEDLRNSLTVVFLPNGNFEVNYDPNAKMYVEPIIRKNNEEMRKEILEEINDLFN
jgi:hypothetical protein